MMKLATFVSIIIVSSSAFCQNSTDIKDFQEEIQSSIKYQSITYSEKAFIAQKGNNSIVLAQLKTGDKKLESFPSNIEVEGEFRPEGMSKNYYLEYKNIPESILFETENQSFVDYSRPADLSNGINAVDARLDSRNAYRSQGAIMDIDSTGGQVYDRETRYEQNMERTRSQQYNTRSKHSTNNSTTRIFSHNDSFICFDDSYDNVVVLTEKGQVLASNEIRISKPQVWSNKGQNIFYDKTQKSFYMVCKTNYGFNWYSIETNTGETELVYQIKSIWPNPNWKLDNGVLSYTQESKGQSTLVEQKLN